MVNDRLTEIAQNLAGVFPKKILVTGGTGFVGSHLARTLASAGHEIVITGRNRYRQLFGNSSIRMESVDLTDSGGIENLCEGQDLVYHVAARSAPWGARQEFWNDNVLGTQNVVTACRKHHVPRLVHVSSTAIHFQFNDALQIAENSPLPRKFCCHYAESKAEAEKIVLGAAADGLNAIIIRARAVFGPGDNSLLPRLIAAARTGRLRQIGDGGNRIDMTHIDNLVLALLLAAERGDAGSVFTITNDEPVLLWPLLREILQKLDLQLPSRSVAARTAMTAATVLESRHQWLKLPGEPLLTRYAVGLLSRSQTFDLSEARRVLRYDPLISMQEGVRRTMAHMTAKDESDAVTSVRIRFFSTGYTAHPAFLAERGASFRRRIRFHAMFALLEHPTEGLTLFDTGYAPRFFSATQRWPYSLYRWMTPVDTCDQLSAVSVLQRAGIQPADIRRIVLSHFHADHTGGLLDFPRADIIATNDSWQDVKGRTGMAAVKRAILPDQLPPDLAKRLHLIEHFHGPGFGPFPATHDLFGDGSVRMVDLTGHAHGQSGLLLQTDTGRILLAADAVWTSRAFRENLYPTPGFRMLAASVRDSLRSQQRLYDLSKQFPAVEIVPTHCPEVAARYGFDEEVDHWLKISRESENSPSAADRS